MVAWPAVVTFIPLLAALLLVAGRGGSPRPAAPSGSASPPAARALDEAAVEQIPVAPAHWAACGNGLQCASVDVPVDYAHPAGPRLRIAVARHPADDPTHRAGVLMFNPGGPALSGIKALRLAADAFPAEIRARFDIVTLDPRGAGGSSPLACGPAIATATAAQPVPPAAGPLPATVPYQALLDDCRHRDGGLPPFITTANTARDLDLVRRAVGAPSVSFLGLSYGTLLGAQYARLFGDHLRAAILDGPIDPAETITDQAADEAAAAEAAVRAMPALAAFDALRERLARAPLPAPGHGDPTPVTEGDLDLATLTYLSAPSLTPNYQGALQAALRGDGSALRDLAVGQFTDIDGTSVLAAYWTITCNDTAERPSPDQAGALARDLAARYPRLGGEAVSFYLGACPVWPAAREPLSTIHLPDRTVPLLVIGGTADPITPYQWAARLATSLGPAVVLTRVGPGHTAFAAGRADACIARYESAYLLNHTPPPARARCGP